MQARLCAPPGRSWIATLFSLFPDSFTSIAHDLVGHNPLTYTTLRNPLPSI